MNDSKETKKKSFEDVMKHIKEIVEGKDHHIEIENCCVKVTINTEYCNHCGGDIKDEKHEFEFEEEDLDEMTSDEYEIFLEAIDEFGNYPKRVRDKIINQQVSLHNRRR